MPTFSLKDFRLGNPAEITQGIINSIAAFIGAKLFYNANGRKRRLLSYLGMLNNLIYCYASDRGVLKRRSNKKGDERYEIDESKVQELITPGSVSIALSGTRDYMTEWWGFKLFRSPDNIREMRSKLSELGLFTFVAPEFKIQKKGEPSVADPACYDGFNIMKALLAYQAIEGILVDGTAMVAGHGWEALPEHRGAMMKRLYDLIFKSGLGMSRSPSPDAGTGEAMTEDEAAIEREVMKANSADEDRNEYVTLFEILPTWVKAQYDRAGGELQEMFEEARDRLAYLKSKLFSRHESVPMDADLPY